MGLVSPGLILLHPEFVALLLRRVDLEMGTKTTGVAVFAAIVDEVKCGEYAEKVVAISEDCVVPEEVLGLDLETGLTWKELRNLKPPALRIVEANLVPPEFPEAHSLKA